MAVGRRNNLRRRSDGLYHNLVLARFSKAQPRAEGLVSRRLPQPTWCRAHASGMPTALKRIQHIFLEDQAVGLVGKPGSHRRHRPAGLQRRRIRVACIASGFRPLSTGLRTAARSVANPVSVRWYGACCELPHSYQFLAPAFGTVLTHLAFFRQREFSGCGRQPREVHRSILYCSHPDSLVMVLLQVSLRHWAHSRP